MTCSSLTNIEIQNLEENDSVKKNSEVLFSHKEKAIFRKNQIKQILELEKHGLLGII